jgi:hypothetical protein
MIMQKDYLPLPKDARVIEKENVKYPSVTTILSGVDPIDFPEYKLMQYAARGSIVHAQAKHFLRAGKWEDDPLKIPRTPDEVTRMNHDVSVVTHGTLHLRWQDCNFLGFMEKYGTDFKPWKGGIGDDVLFNEDYVYSGTPDWPCLYKDEPAIVEFKTSSNYPPVRMRKFKKQMSAYANCVDPQAVKTLVLAPINPKNKCGFGEPIIERDIDKYFNLFKEDRFTFSEIFGY